MRTSIRQLRLASLATALTAMALLAGCSAAPVQRVAVALGTPIAAPGTGRQAEVVAIGDSIAYGKGVAPGEAWPAIVAADHGWHLTDLAVSGSGFVRAGWNGTTFQQQVDRALELRPAYILIAATRNDGGENPVLVAQNCTAMLDTLRSTFPRARIIGISAVWGSDQPPDTVKQVDEAFGAAVTAVHGAFLDIGFPLVDHAAWLQADLIHPNATGQHVVAKAIEDKLALVAPTR